MERRLDRDVISFDRPTEKDIPPSPWVVRFAPLIAVAGTVLDVACGHGRHVRFLRECGYIVTAADIDVSGLECMVVDPRINIIEADLEARMWPFAGKTYDGIVVVNYLYRPHFSSLVTSLAEGGVLIFETFGAGNEFLGRPRNPDFLLAPGELLDVFSHDLQIVAYEHGEETSPRPAVRQRLCAIKGGGPYRLP